MLYGKIPFLANSEIQLINNIKKELINPNGDKFRPKVLPSTPFISPIVKDLICRMLMYREEDRISF
jgi:hypothetical protein